MSIREARKILEDAKSGKGWTWHGLVDALEVMAAGEKRAVDVLQSIVQSPRKEHLSAQTTMEIMEVIQDSTGLWDRFKPGNEVTKNE